MQFCREGGGEVWGEDGSRGGRMAGDGGRGGGVQRQRSALILRLAKIITLYTHEEHTTRRG